MAKNTKQLAAARSDQKGLTVMDYLNSAKCKRAFEEMTPRFLSWERLYRLTVVNIQRNPKLMQAEPVELIRQSMGFSTLGLEIGSPLGHGWILPFESQGKVILQSVIGYQGMVELMFRSSFVRGCQADVVTAAEYEAQLFDWKKGSNQFLDHVYSDDRNIYDDTLRYSWALAKLEHESVFEVLPWNQIEATRNRSPGYRYAKSRGETTPTYKQNPWVADVVSMAKKTAIRQLWKLVPKTPDMALAVAMDEAGERGDVSTADVIDLDPESWTVERTTSKPVSTPPADSSDAKEEPKKAEGKKSTPKKTKAKEPAKEPEGDPRPEPPAADEPAADSETASKPAQEAVEASEPSEPEEPESEEGEEGDGEIWGEKLI